MIKIDWEKCGGLIPAIITDAKDNSVLMLAYMNEEALNLSLQTGFAHYFSRSKNRIWKKGEESGNVQKIERVMVDCDNDTLLIYVCQNGSACHTGAKSCFFKEIKFDGKIESNIDENAKNLRPKYDVLDEIYHLILDRKLNADPQNSYVAKLFSKGENAILKKICEEAGEFAFACKDLSEFEKMTRIQTKFQSEICENLDTNLIKQQSEILDEISSSNLDASQNSQTFARGANLAKFHSEFDPQKFGEHIKGDPKYDVVYECADLIFHALVALAGHNISPKQILDELIRREGTSGIAEKNSRKN